MILAVFASFVVTYPRRLVQSHNSTAPAERPVGAVRGFYEHMHGRSPATCRGMYFTRTLRGVMTGLKKLYPATPMSKLPMLGEDMRAIRSVMRINDLRDFTYWTLSASQWQGVMRCSGMMRLASDKTRKWESAKDTYVARITWEDVYPTQNGACKTRMRWCLKPSKTY